MHYFQSFILFFEFLFLIIRSEYVISRELTHSIPCRKHPMALIDAGGFRELSGEKCRSNWDIKGNDWDRKGQSQRRGNASGGVLLDVHDLAAMERGHRVNGWGGARGAGTYRIPLRGISNKGNTVF